MKRFFILLSTVGLIFASDLIQYDKVENLAQRFVNEQFGFHYLDKVITYYGIDELPGAYAMIFRNREIDPLTIVMGARYTTSPINEISRVLPRSQTVFDKILQKARTLADCEPEFQKIYYFGPGEEYCAFNIGDKDILINACTFRTIEKSFLLRNKPEPNQELELLTRQKWNKYFTTPNFSTRQDSSGYIPNVPFIDWTYGCSPTAASMILWYWDSYAPNPHYGRLVDYFFTRWEMVYEQWKDGANVNRELAIAMYTDSATGGTYISNIRNGMITVANTWNGYACTGSTSPQGGSWNQYQFSWIKTEINAGRPCHWNVFNHYPQVWPPPSGHSLTGVGYLITDTPCDTFVQVHTTWGWSGEPYWALWTYHDGVYSTDHVVTFVPGGSNSNNLFLTYPQQGGTMFKNLKYYLCWESVGSDIDHIKIWYSIGRQASSYDSSYWTVIESSAPNTGKYLWTVPDQDSAFRINIAGFNSSNQRLAADGTFYPNSSRFPDHSSNLTLVGHFETPEVAGDIVVNGTYGYITDGTNGLVVADFSDSSLPDEIYHLQLPGDNVTMFMISPNLYLADKTDTMRVISIANPIVPTQVGKCYLNVDQPTEIFVLGEYAYVAARVSGLVIIDIVNPSTPTVVSYFDTPGQCYDVLVSDTLAYLADGTTGLRIVNIADPLYPVEIGSYNTNGIAQGLELNGTTLYLADGNSGIKIFDVADPTNPQLISSFDTPGTAKNALFSSPSILFVADGAGIRVLDVLIPSSLVEIGYMGSFGTATNLAVLGALAYLADGTDGIYIIHADITGIKETVSSNLMPHILISSPQTHSIKFNFSLNRTQDIDIRIYDASGRLCKFIEKLRLSSGKHEFQWLLEVSGVYFIQIETNNGVKASKVVFLKQ